MSRERIAKFQESKATCIRRMETLSDQAADDDCRDLNEEESKEYTQLEAKVLSLETQIAREKNRPVYAGESAIVNGDLHQESTRQKEVAKSADGFESFGQMLQAVAAAGDPSKHRVDKRLVEFGAAPTGMNETTPADGGYLVTLQTTNELMKRTYDSGVLFPLVRKIRIGPGKNGLVWNRVKDNDRRTGFRMGGLRFYWLAEADLKTPSTWKVEQSEMKLKKVAALMYATDELLEDAVALEDLTREFFGDELAFELDDVIWRGSGVGQPLGFMNSAAKITVATDTTLAVGADLDDLLAMRDRFLATSINRGSGMWLIGQGVMSKFMKMTIGDMPIYLPAGASRFGGATLLDIPVRQVEHAEPLGTTGDIVLFDPKEYLMINKSDRMQMATSIHVRFIYDETCFRFVYRCDGAPLYNLPITPYKGTLTTSPIVTLATRAA